MKLLCIEGSTDDWSVAIVDDGRVVDSENHSESNTMASLLAVSIKNTLNQAQMGFQDLDGIAIGAGPGSYTGLRIVASTAKGLSLGADLPLLAVPSLKALAMETFKNRDLDFCLAMIDARRNDVFCALYDKMGQEIWPAQILTLQNDTWQSLPKGKIGLCGNGILKLSPFSWPDNYLKGPDRCSASYLFEPANQLFNNKAWENLAGFSPFYLLPPNITSSKK